MKRFLIPFLFLLILVIPVSADEFSSNEVINLLDYCTINGDNHVSDFDFYLYDVPEHLKSIPVYGIDLVYRVIYGESPPSANFISNEGDIYLEYHYLGNNLYRMIGRSDTPCDLQDAFIEFEAEDFFSIYLYQINIDVEGNITNYSNTGGLVSTSNGEYFGYNGDYTHEDIIAGSDAPDPEDEYYISTFDTYVFPQKWYLFDEYHFTFSTDSLGIVEVVAELTSGEVLPVSVSYYNPVTDDNTSVSIIVSVDLSDCDRDINKSLRITIKSRYYLYQNNFITISQPNGTVNTKPNFFGIWFNKIVSAIRELTEGNASQIRDSDKFDQTAESQASELDEMVSVMGSVEQPDISNVNLDLTSGIDSNILTATTSGFSTVLSNEILIRVLIMALTLGLVGFILYGKKG